MTARAAAAFDGADQGNFGGAASRVRWVVPAGTGLVAAAPEVSVRRTKAAVTPQMASAAIPFDKPGRHRPGRLTDLLAYQQRSPSADQDDRGGAERIDQSCRLYAGIRPTAEDDGGSDGGLAGLYALADTAGLVASSSIPILAQDRHGDALAR